jgi:hypothetical protein
MVTSATGLHDRTSYSLSMPCVMNCQGQLLPVLRSDYDSCHVPISNIFQTLSTCHTFSSTTLELHFCPIVYVTTLPRLQLQIVWLNCAPPAKYDGSVEAPFKKPQHEKGILDQDNNHNNNNYDKQYDEDFSLICCAHVWAIISQGGTRPIR